MILPLPENLPPTMFDTLDYGVTYDENDVITEFSCTICTEDVHEKGFWECDMCGFYVCKECAFIDENDENCAVYCTHPNCHERAVKVEDKIVCGKRKR